MPGLCIANHKFRQPWDRNRRERWPAVGFDDRVSATLHLDYLQPSLTRFATFTGNRGTIVWNLAERSVSHTTHGMQPNLFSYQNARPQRPLPGDWKGIPENQQTAGLCTWKPGLKACGWCLPQKVCCRKQPLTLTEKTYSNNMFILGHYLLPGGSKGIAGKNIKTLSGQTFACLHNGNSLPCLFVIKWCDSIYRQWGNWPGCPIKWHQYGDWPAGSTGDRYRIQMARFYPCSRTIWRVERGLWDYLVDMDVTVPLKTTADIDGAIQTALAKPGSGRNHYCVWAGAEPYFNMMEIGGNGFASIVKAQPQPVVRRQDAPVYSLCPAAYVIKRAALYAYDHWSKAKCMLYVIPRSHAVDIDTAFDFQLVEF